MFSMRNPPASVEELLFDDTEYAVFGNPFPAITAVSKQLRSETLDTYASLNHFHLTDETSRWLPQSDNIKVLGTTSFLQSMKKITFTGHFIGAGYNMGLLLVAMKERGDLHPMLEPHIRHCSWPTSTIAQDYHFCRQGPLSQQLLNGFDQINKTLGRGKRLSARQWQQARSEFASALEQSRCIYLSPASYVG